MRHAQSVAHVQSSIPRGWIILGLAAVSWGLVAAVWNATAMVFSAVLG